MEKAIALVADSVREKCRNKKPLILHSIRVGLKLLELKQPRELVVAGILHDLIEDTDCTINQIRKAFGVRVARLVSAVTQAKIVDYQKRWRILMDKIKKTGKAAMILKLVDINENLTYLSLVKDKEELKKIYWKHNFAMGQLKPYLGNLKIFQECRNGYKRSFKKAGLKYFGS